MAKKVKETQQKTLEQQIISMQAEKAAATFAKPTPYPSATELVQIGEALKAKEDIEKNKLKLEDDLAKLTFKVAEKATTLQQDAMKVVKLSVESQDRNRKNRC